MRYITFLSAIFAISHAAASAQAPKVPIVANDKPVWTKGKEWRPGVRPTLEIGVAEGRPEYELSNIRGALRLSDGTIVVANQNPELRYYDARGGYLRTAGRRGDGPGEFKGITGLSLLRDGNIAVADFPHGIQVYSPAGKFVRLHPSPAGTSAPAALVFDDASVIVASRRPVPRGGTGVYTDSIALSVYRSQGPTPLGTFPVSRFVSLGSREGFMILGPALKPAARGQIWYLGFSDRWQITQYNANGTPLRIIRRSWKPVEITAADRQRFREAPFTMTGEGGAGAAVTPRLLEQRKRIYVDDAFAKTLPAFGELRVDAAGNLWAEVPHSRPIPARVNATIANPKEWSVFDTNGRWLGQVQTPANFWVFEIGSDYVLGLWRDELDVEHIRLYPLVKP